MLVLQQISFRNRYITYLFPNLSQNNRLIIIVMITFSFHRLSMASLYIRTFKERHNFDAHNSQTKLMSTKNLLEFRFTAWINLSIILIYHINQSHSIFSEMIVMSSHGLFLSWLFFTVILQDHFVNNLNQRSTLSISSDLKYFAQFVFELSVCLQTANIVIFWGLIYESLLSSHSFHQIVYQILMHSLPASFLIVDWMANGCTFQRPRLIFIIVYGFLYGLINYSNSLQILAYSANVAPIYRFINWKDTKSFMVVILATTLMISTHLVGNFVYRKYKEDKEVEDVALVPKPPKMVKKESERSFNFEPMEEDIKK